MSRKQYLLIAGALSLGFVCGLGYTGYKGVKIWSDLGKTLITAPVRTKTGNTTWGKVLNTESPFMAAAKCSNNNKCNTWFVASLNQRMNTDTHIYLLMGLFMATILAWRSVPSALARKDPGQGKWAGLDDDGILDVIKVPVRNKLLKKQEAWLDNWSPRTTYIGHALPWSADGFDWQHPRLAYLRERKSHENIMVTGAPGSGKTRGFFRQNVILAAERGDTAIVFDLKWPQMDSGFKDLILYWHRRGRPVYIFAPFSPNSMRLPLLEGIDNLNEALKLARTIIPSPEYGEETGKFYKDIERRALASMILAIAQSPTPTMKELQRLGQMNVTEFEGWYRRQQNPEIKANLKAMFDQRVDQISATLAGTLSTLQIFFSDNVSRATTAGSNPEETINLKQAIREGALIMIGIESKHIQGNDGAILLQLTKRRIDQAVMDVADESPGGMLARTCIYFLDELTGLSRLPYLMSNLSQLRSKGVSMMLGLQNAEQGGVVYTRDYWKALSANNLGTRIDFIQGTEGDGAKALSEEIGQTTVYASGASKSTHAFFGSIFSPEARKTENLKLEKVPILSVEEIKRSPPNLAVVNAKGQNPILVATPAIDKPTMLLRTPDGKHVVLKNQLYTLWKNTMGDVKNLEAEVNALILQRSVGGQNAVKEVVQAAPEYWQDWLGALLNDGAMCRKIHNEDKIKIKIRKDTLSERLSKERDLSYFISCGWLNISDNEEELTITQDGLTMAGKVLRNSLLDFLICGPALYWMRKNVTTAKHTPETLTVTIAQVTEMYAIVPDLPRVTVAGVEHVIIPLSNPKALSEAISRAEIALGRQEAGTTRRAAPAKKNTPDQSTRGNDVSMSETPGAEELTDLINAGAAAGAVTTAESDNPDPDLTPAYQAQAVAEDQDPPHLGEQADESAHTIEEPDETDDLLANLDDEDRLK